MFWCQGDVKVAPIENVTKNLIEVFLSEIFVNSEPILSNLRLNTLLVHLKINDIIKFKMLYMCNTFFPYFDEMVCFLLLLKDIINKVSPVHILCIINRKCEHIVWFKGIMGVTHPWSAIQRNRGVPSGMACCGKRGGK